VPGLTVVDIDHETGKQFKVYSIGGHVRGKLDGKVYGLPEAPKTWHVLECKSHNDKNFKEVVKKGIKVAKPSHWWQCQKYMELTGLDRCLYIAVNKNTDELHAERIEYDFAAVVQLNVRLERIITQNVAPGRICEDPNKYPCIFCRHKAVCHREAFGRQHCRSCLHSTPMVTLGDTSAPWLCEKFGRTLSVDEQRAGCHAHLYLPDVVPGYQEDSGDDWVSYTLSDGSGWTDQEKKPPPEPEPEDIPTDCGVCGATVHQHCFMSGAFQGCPRDLGKLQNKPPELPAPSDQDRYRYWYRPSTGEVWSTEFASHDSLVALGEVEELSAEEFAQAETYYASLESGQ
jgi:hypothetical protein